MGKKQRLALFIILSLLLTGQTLSALTLDEALEQALENNAGLAAQTITLDAAARNKRFGWNQFLPSINPFSVGIGNTHYFYTPQQSVNPLTGRQGAKAGDSTWGWNDLSLGVSFSFNADIPNRFKDLEQKYGSALLDYDNTKQTLVKNVSTQFYSLLAEKKNISLLSDNLDISKAQYDSVKASYDRGLASELDLLNAEYAWRTAGPALETADKTYRQNRATFCLLIGLDPASEPELSGEIAVRELALPDAGELVKKHLDARYDVASGRNDVAAKELAAKSNVTQSTPSLSVGETISLSPESGEWPGFGDPTFSGRFSIGVSIPINPWIPGTSGDLARKGAKDAVASARISYDSTRKQAEQDIWAKSNAIEQARSAIDTSAMNSSITERAYELSAQGARAGLVNQDDLQTANNRRLEAEQAVVQAQVGYITAVYSLAEALGMDIERLYGLYGRD
jgi:multidrug efflux system outer membrane protein